MLPSSGVCPVFSRCHIPVAGSALLGLADASGSIQLLRLGGSEVSDRPGSVGGGDWRD